MEICPACRGDPGSAAARWCGRCGAPVGEQDPEVPGPVLKEPVARRSAVGVFVVLAVMLSTAFVVRVLPSSGKTSDLDVSLPPADRAAPSTAIGPRGEDGSGAQAGRPPGPGTGMPAEAPGEESEPLSPRWSASLPGWPNGSVVTRSGILVRTTARVALVDEGGGAWSEKAPTNPGVNGRPLVTDGLVIVGSHDGRLSALDLDSGEVRWRRRHVTGTREAPVPVAASDGTLAVWTPSHGVAGVALEDGQETWRERFDLFESPRTDGAGAMFAIVGRDLVKIDVATGDVAWTFRDTSARRLSRLAVGGGRVVVFAGLDLAVLEADSGRLSWRHERRAPASGRPVVVDGLVAVPEARGHGTSLAGLSLRTGVPRWRRTLPRFTTLTTAGDKFMAVTMGQAVRIIDPTTGRTFVRAQPRDISVVNASRGRGALAVAGTRLNGTRLHAYPVPGGRQPQSGAQSGPSSGPRSGPLPGAGAINGVR